jgi:hypothetical protein
MKIPYDEYFGIPDIEDESDAEWKRLKAQNNRLEQIKKNAEENALQRKIGLGAGAAGALYWSGKLQRTTKPLRTWRVMCMACLPKQWKPDLMKKYPQPPASAQVARQTAQELSEQAAWRCIYTSRRCKTGDVPLDDSGARRWALSRVAPKYAPPHSMTDKIITLTGSAGAPGSAEISLLKMQNECASCKPWVTMWPTCLNRVTCCWLKTTELVVLHCAHPLPRRLFQWPHPLLRRPLRLGHRTLMI